ncbi:MAG: GGDEF domain-containing protein [Gammaproteobacteria bacterium]|nr:GGDEF domain-containing protein [Gammaproteobacteria bacterium]
MESENQKIISRRWLRNADGGFSIGKGSALTLLLLMASSFVVASAGLSLWVTAGLSALLGAMLVYALVLVPLASNEIVSPDGASHLSANSMDELTHLPNRRAIVASLIEVMSYASRYNHAVCVALIDIDHLALLNDRHGRRAGDRALQAVASVFGESLRLPDRAGRYGEEEFLVIMPSTVLKNAVKVAERLRRAVEVLGVKTRGESMAVKVSVGVAQYRKGEDLNDFLARVEKMLAAAKSAGRNRVAAPRAA